MSEGLTQEQMNNLDQQRRVILDTKNDVAALLEILMRLQARYDSYIRLGLSDDTYLMPEAFGSTGTDAIRYRSAMATVEALRTLLAQGHGTNLEKFAR